MVRFGGVLERQFFDLRLRCLYQIKIMTRLRKYKLRRTKLFTDCCARLAASGSDMEEITGCNKGRTISLSMSIEEAGEGGGSGEILRRMPMHASEIEVAKILGSRNNLNSTPSE